jgi:hypothetical protein
MIDPTSARNDRLRDTGRWGYTGEMLDDPVPAVEDEGGVGRWLLWAAVIALAVIAIVLLTGSVL